MDLQSRKSGARPDSQKVNHGRDAYSQTSPVKKRDQALDDRGFKKEEELSWSYEERLHKAKEKKPRRRGSG